MNFAGLKGKELPWKV